MNENETGKPNNGSEQEKKDSHKKVSFYLAIFFFVIIIIADVALIINHEKVFSETENRMLEQSPKITGTKLVSGKFMSQFEDFVSDQFFLRDNWIQTNLKTDIALGKKESNGVYLGKDGYLFEKTAEPDPGKIETTVNAINDLADKNPELNHYMAIVPNATEIHPAKIPAGAPVRKQAEDIETTKKLLSNNVTFIDLIDVLKSHQDEQLYYKSDHHWTSLGAKYAFEEIASSMRLDGVTGEYDVKTVTENFSGTMASASGSFNTTDKIDIYIPGNIKEYYVEYDGDPAKYATIYKSEALEHKDKYEVFFGGNYPKIKITTVNDNGRNLLLLKDSYANCFVQFLLPYYDSIVVVDPRYYSEDISKDIGSSDITDVLILYNENTFVEDNSLAGILAE